MNKYRTVPGLGPSVSKATSNTTCQKCLKKGHYSYECKSSVQSRPYTSRPSRSQQLQNPKLKPALAEQKMEEPQPTASSPSDPLAKVEADRLGRQQDLAEDGESSKKRRRSASLSSISSTATISTNASEPMARTQGARTNRRGYTDARSRSRSRSSSAARATPPVPRTDSRRTRDRSEDQRSHRSASGTRPVRGGDRIDQDDHAKRPVRRTDIEPGYRERNRADHRERDRPGKRRRSRSAEGLPGENSNRSVPNNSTRQRSLSPYSRRLALTQAMNANS